MDIGCSGENHSPFVTPKRHNHSSTLDRTPGRRKLALDDENENGSEKKGHSRTAGGGLRQFSVMVCQKLEAKKITTYKEVADEIISDFATTQNDTLGSSEEFNEKNIRRRVYDALNVFMALDIIARDKKEIRWKGLPITRKKDVGEVNAERTKLVNSVQKKAAYLKELEEKVLGLQNLTSRNQQVFEKSKCHTEGFTLPFILVQTSPHATVEVEISEDMQLVHFDFNSTPFTLHDDAYILKLMHQQKLQPNANHHTSQHSSALSSSSSCVVSGTTGPVVWNTNSTTTR
ncbi:PREDICTED: transcription factor-like protein DPA [Tarenaya hassleriana]|uniref:transcription factor-like protein DPA n=1 Tax=Tarenaya hassleriana TaxID=28532 RepID=UPI00053C0FA1|nr:PREDICTED: transcription factor-like protein DPA [Tarenaya hassleriana]XP_010543317.1 PREDICTED: transcription factor-like protein DPA [Tarenaya hassleriana]